MNPAMPPQNQLRRATPSTAIPGQPPPMPGAQNGVQMAPNQVPLNLTPPPGATPQNPFPQTNAPQGRAMMRGGPQMPPPGARPPVGGPVGPTPGAPMPGGGSPMPRPPVGVNATPNPMNGGASNNLASPRSPVNVPPAPPAGTPNVPMPDMSAGQDAAPMPPGMMPPPGVRPMGGAMPQGSEGDEVARQRNFQAQQTGGNPQLRTTGRPMMQNRAPQEDQSTQ